MAERASDQRGTSGRDSGESEKRVKLADDKKVREAAARIAQRDKELLKRLAR